MITADQALEAAREEMSRVERWRDPMFAGWAEASLGEPVLVRDVFKTPSYWLVPVVIRARAGGFIRVLGTGMVAATGVFYADSRGIDACPATVTGIDRDQARSRAEEKVDRAGGETAAEPVYVHDGPAGREAWLVEVLKDDTPIRWVFVTPAFVYERAAGQLLDETLE